MEIYCFLVRFYFFGLKFLHFHLVLGEILAYCVVDIDWLERLVATLFLLIGYLNIP